MKKVEKIATYLQFPDKNYLENIKYYYLLLFRKYKKYLDMC